MNPVYEFDQSAKFSDLLLDKYREVSAKPLAKITNTIREKHGMDSALQIFKK
jgi:hypothetical protein